MKAKQSIQRNLEREDKWIDKDMQAQFDMLYGDAGEDDGESTDGDEDLEGDDMADPDENFTANDIAGDVSIHYHSPPAESEPGGGESHPTEKPPTNGGGGIGTDPSPIAPLPPIISKPPTQTTPIVVAPVQPENSKSNTLPLVLASVLAGAGVGGVTGGALVSNLINGDTLQPAPIVITSPPTDDSSRRPSNIGIDH